MITQRLPGYLVEQMKISTPVVLDLNLKNSIIEKISNESIRAEMMKAVLKRLPKGER